MQQRKGSHNLRSIVARALILVTALFFVAAVQAATVQRVVPQGEMPQVRQVAVTFAAAEIPFGDLRQPAPVSVDCRGAAVSGSGRWTSEREWVYDFVRPLPPGTRCMVKARAGWTPRSAPWSGRSDFAFSTGGPAVVSVRPSEGETIEEDQHFVLRLTGPAIEASVAARARCEVEGLGETLAVRVVGGALREQVIKLRQLEKAAADVLVLACQRPLAPEAKVRLVWGTGIAAAADASLVTKVEQRFDFQVRALFKAEFSCERERADAPCVPIRPMTVAFSSPVARAVAAAVRLKPAAGGDALAPVFERDDKAPEVEAVKFPIPLAENAAYVVELPADVRDAAGRVLSNASAFPLKVATGAAPPIAKFAAAPFGVVELNADAMLPVTLRHVQGDLRPGAAASAGAVRVRHHDSDADVLAAYAKVAKYHESFLTAKEAGRPAAEWYEWVDDVDARGRPVKRRQEQMVATRELSLLNGDAAARRLDLPALQGGDPRPFEVIGIPLAQPGYQVVEIASARLGAALLAKPQPMFVRTGVLVTNLGVHFKRARDGGLVWVTRLDSARPVEGAEVAVNDCRGTRLWAGRTGADGVARIDQLLATDDRADCPADGGLFVTARKTVESGPAKGATDMAFVFSSWQKGIEPWRFAVPTGSWSDRDDLRAATVFDRTLLRAGETVSMKHFVRHETTAGIAPPAAAELPARLKITHQGSGESFTQPLDWRGGRSAASSWRIPTAAKLGLYEVTLEAAATDGARPRSKAQGLAAGSFRVEAFRVPLVDARFSAPSASAAAIAPRELPLAVQLNYLSGGAMAQAPARVSALLKPAGVSFDGVDDFSFEPPRDLKRDAEREAAAASGVDEVEDGANPAARDGGRLVADKLPLTTDAQGAATVVLKDLPALDRPSELLTELTFDDPNGEVQTAQTRLTLWPAGVVVGIKSRAWASRRGGDVALDAVALDPQGRPVKGQKLDIRARLAQTITTRKRIVGGFYAYDNRVEVTDLGAVCSGSTDAQGRFTCRAKLDVAGQVELIAEAKDAAGRAAQAATSVWLTGRDELWFAQDNDDRIDLLPEKRQVEPGETARLQVRMPFREATALIAVEREGIVATRVATLRGDDPTIDVKIEPGWAPNVYVSVLALRGRIREVPWYSFFTWGWKEPLAWVRAFRFEGRDHQAPTARVDLSKPAFKLGVAQLKVGLAAHRLDVAVSADRPQYAVRQKAIVKVRVSQGGKPAAGAEVAFAAVDEGLLALQPNGSWNLLEAMLRPRPWRVETATGQGEIIGRRHYGRKAVAAGGGGGGSPTRELFDTLLLWNPAVALDANGEATLEVPLNDSLTSFRLVAVADDGSTRFGTGTASIRVTQDVQALSGLPPLAREGDRFTAQLTVRNTTARAMALKVGLSGAVTGEGAAAVPVGTTTAATAAGAMSSAAESAATRASSAPGGGTASVGTSSAATAASGSSPATAAAGATVPSAPALAPIVLPPQDVTLAAGAASEVVWSVDVPAGAAAIAWEATVEEQPAPGAAPSAAPAAGRARDRLKVMQRVVPAVPVRVLQATLQPLDATFALAVAPPADALGTTVAAFGAVAAPVPASSVLDGGGPKRGGIVVAVQPTLAGALPGLRRWFETYPYACLEQQVAKALGLGDAARWRAVADALPTYLDRDGLAVYFPPGPDSAPVGSDRLTAHLIAVADEAGAALPPEALRRMLDGLAAFVEGRIERRFWSPRPDLDVRKLAALDALARHGRAEARQLGSINLTPALWPTAAMIDWRNLLRRVNGIPDRAKRLAEADGLLRARLAYAGTTLTFSTEESDDWWWLMDNADANAARLVVAVLDDAGWKDEVPRLVLGTLGRQRGGAWRTTAANVWGTIALRKFSARFESAPVTGRTLARLEAGAGAAGVAPAAVAAPSASSAASSSPLRQSAIDWSRSPQGGTVRLPWGGLTAATPGRLTVAQEGGSGRPWLTVQSLAAVPLKAPLFAGYRITRNVTAVEQKTAGRWSRGDVLRVRLEIDAQSDRTWVAVSDPVPAGATLLGSGLGRDSAIATQGERSGDRAWPVYVERTFEAYRAYFDRLPPGRHVVEYTVRLNTVGRFALPPTRVEALYAPETFGEMPNAGMEVGP